MATTNVGEIPGLPAAPVPALRPDAQASAAAPTERTFTVPRYRLLVAIVAPCTLALAACGGGGTPKASPATTGYPAIPASELSPAGSPGQAPTMKVPGGKPPTKFEATDLIVGKGAVAKKGDNVQVQYVLGTYSAGKAIQSSWTSSPFSFTLGAGQVVPGFDMAVTGMRVGGRREVIIPPQLGYGSRSPGAGIAVNDTLVFIIDLVKIG
ncbi:MAG TPA: FKBP-type peptidyl-prolyl cis-trans isomerase [Acidimicrobiales bacterium]|nr:FKBP-type peptidyl-prolyl cis-trans isomerase [Acidimicrobiales bacterium]